MTTGYQKGDQVIYQQAITGRRFRGEVVRGVTKRHRWVTVRALFEIDHNGNDIGFILGYVYPIKARDLWERKVA